jgi:hypothetical protein
VSRKLCPRTPSTKLAFVRRSILNTNSERKTVIIGESKDFRAFAAFGGPHCEAPFLLARRRRQQRPPPSRVFLVLVTPRPGHARCARVCVPAPIAGNGDGRSGTAGISWPIPAAAPQHPTPTPARASSRAEQLAGHIATRSPLRDSVPPSRCAHDFAVSPHIEADLAAVLI